MRSETHLRSIIFCGAIVFFCSACAMAGTWETLQVPGATSATATGVDGGNIVGYFRDASNNEHGFLYDGSRYKVLDASTWWTEAFGVSGNKIVGEYLDFSYATHAFVYTIPEPATLMLLGLGAVVLRKKRS